MWPRAAPVGSDVQAWALVGVLGAQVRQLLADEGVAADIRPIAGDTRENFRSSKLPPARISLRAARPHPADCGMAGVPGCPDHTHRAPRWLIASGSLPPACRMILCPACPRSRARGTRCGGYVWPATGAALRLAPPDQAQPARIARSAAAAVEHPATSARPRNAGALGQTEMVALSLGARRRAHARWGGRRQPCVRGQGTTGAGDRFLAALVWSLDRGAPPPDALRWGMAAGAAALLVPGTALARATDVHRLQSQVIVRASPV